jgi:hydroxymethylbilane synthase
MAGLARLGLTDRASQVFTVDEMVPAVGQGALALQVRADDEEVTSVVSTLDNPATRACVIAERAFLRRLGAGCRLPVGAHATIDGDTLRISGILGGADNARLAHAAVSGAVGDAETLGEGLAAELEAKSGMRQARSS